MRLLSHHRRSAAGHSRRSNRRSLCRQLHGPDLGLHAVAFLNGTRRCPTHGPSRFLRHSHTPGPARLGAPLVDGMGPAWTAMEALIRNMSAEFGPRGVRAISIVLQVFPRRRRSTWSSACMRRLWALCRRKVADARKKLPETDESGPIPPSTRKTRL